MADSLSWLLQLIQRKIKWIAVIIILQSFFSLFGVIYAVLFSNLLDFAIDGSISNINIYTQYFIIVLLSQYIVYALLKTIREKTLIDIEGLLKRRMLNNIFFRDFAYVSSIHSGEWMNKLNSDVGIVTRNAVDLLPNVVGIAVHLFAASFVLFKMIPDFMIVTICLIIAAVIFELFVYRQYKTLHKEVQEKDGKVRVFLQECINSLMVIKSYVKENITNDKFDLSFEDYKKSRIKRNRFLVIMNFLFGISLNGLLILSGVFCAYAVLRKEITYGVFICVIQIITQIRSPIANMYSSIPNFYSMIGSIERLKEIENYGMDSTQKFISLEDFSHITFDDISFSYLDRNEESHVIENLSFRFKKGEFIAISGPSGCGKSTLLKLLLGLYMPIKGQIIINGNGTDYILDGRFRKHFAYVPQDNQLMEGIIKDVICFGEEFDQMRMDKALEISCCKEFIKKMPLGINTELKEKGSGLSEGQMQRIAIARAIYSDKPILLLDEVTSSLNEELEIRILENLRNMSNKTVLLISHHKKAFDYVDRTISCEEEEGKYRWSIS